MRNLTRTVAACLALAGGQAWAINKCAGADGKVSYQDAPCAAGAKAAELRLAPSAAPAPAAPMAPPVVTAPRTAPVLPASPAPSTLPAAVPAPTFAIPVLPPPKGPIDVMADRCLDWYRPLLRDPRGAYQQDASFDKGVLRITIHATNGYGGYTPKLAACEFKNGVLDADWTKIHAGRAGW